MGWGFREWSRSEYRKLAVRAQPLLPVAHPFSAPGESAGDSKEKVRRANVSDLFFFVCVFHLLCIFTPVFKSCDK